MTPAAAGAAPSGLPLGRGVAAALLAGFGCMAAELTAVRLLAPFFGDSAYVWTNVIGIILAALAMGAWLGGRLAARPDAHVWPTRLLAAAGAWLAVAPYATGALGAWLLPAGLPLDAAMPALVRGSFVATTVVFGPPMLLLGAVSPLLVTLVVRGAVAVGRAAGAIAASGTVGSLLGTFAATHWLVPTLGSRLSIGVAGGLLVLGGVCAHGGRRARAVAVLPLAILAGAMLGHSGPLRPPPPGRELLAERESRYQFLQVQRSLDVVPAQTFLLCNEGLDSFQSLDVAGSALTGGAYYDWHALAPLLAGKGTRPDGLRVLSIGDAAGSLRGVYAGVHPEAVVDGVDIDPMCRELGERFFAADARAAGADFTLDGRVFLERATAQWHVIHVDAYAHQVYVPAHLASREFFAAARARLVPGGVLACNVGGLRRDDPVLRAIGSTIAAEFGHAMALPVPASRNLLVVARNGSPPEPAALSGVSPGRERLAPSDAAAWQRIVAVAADPNAWFDVGTGGPVLVDDRPQLDDLLHDSYLRRDDPGEIVACTGRLEPAGAELEAFTAGRARRWTEVLAVVAQSRAPTAYLRELAGDARWSLRQLRAAVAEYAAALELADAAGSDRLRQKLAAARQELAPIAAAERAATQLGWWQVAAATLLAGLAVWWGRTLR